MAVCIAVIAKEVIITVFNRPTFIHSLFLELLHIFLILKVVSEQMSALLCGQETPKTGLAANNISILQPGLLLPVLSRRFVTSDVVSVFLNIIVCLCPSPLQNYPLYIRSVPTQNELKFHYTVHTSLDVVEEKISAVGKSLGDQRELYLGLLYPTEDYKVYP